MKTLSTLTALGLAGSILATPVEYKRSDAQPIVLEFTGFVNAPRLTNNTSSSFAKRGSISNDPVSLPTQFNYYSTYIQIGTPAQKIEVAVDTGSFDVWAYGPSDQHAGASVYSASKSSTSQDQDQEFEAGYGAGTVDGEWYTDVLGAGGLSVSGFPFGVVSSDQLGSQVPGIIGLSPGIESGNINDPAFETLPVALYTQGKTTTPAFSIFLQSGGTGGGLIIGGLDTDKFTYPFYSFPIVETSDDGGPAPDYVFFSQNVDSYTINGKSVATGPFPTVFDTGAPSSQVPTAVVTSLKSILPSTWKFNSNLGVWYGPSSPKLSSTQFLDVNIGKFTAKIPLSDLVVPQSFLFGTGYTGLPSGDSVIALQGSDSQYLLGDQFFKNIYGVFDAYNKEIYFASPTNNFGASNIVALPNGSGVPSSVAGR